MSRYIDADAFEYELKEIEAITAMTHEEDEEVGLISMPMFTIRNIMRKCVPIDICFCKDCKHWRNGDGACGVCRKTSLFPITKADDFCSYGERKDDV